MPKTINIALAGNPNSGKTSLLNVALKQSKLDYVKIDVRMAPYSNRTLFIEYLSKKFETRNSFNWSSSLR